MGRNVIEREKQVVSSVRLVPHDTDLMSEGVKLMPQFCAACSSLVTCADSAEYSTGLRSACLSRRRIVAPFATRTRGVG
jgi:hypothetical protein